MSIRTGLTGQVHAEVKRCNSEDALRVGVRIEAMAATKVDDAKSRKIGARSGDEVWKSAQGKNRAKAEKKRKTHMRLCSMCVGTANE
ncbi:hypothetical protein [Paraburkholderia sp. J63]|uniref:hypothetical protein n=1 Tax=Paraburkholderia sp. J63 TaxID=2805434 RepID=UPI002ABE3415|nr:hypothetical protein [Paraburkholderia sp. J63]